MCSNTELLVDRKQENFLYNSRLVVLHVIGSNCTELVDDGIEESFCSSLCACSCHSRRCPL